MNETCRFSPAAERTRPLATATSAPNRTTRCRANHSTEMFVLKQILLFERNPVALQELSILITKRTASMVFFLILDVATDDLFNETVPKPMRMFTLEIPQSGFPSTTSTMIPPHFTHFKSLAAAWHVFSIDLACLKTLSLNTELVSTNWMLVCSGTICIDVKSILWHTVEPHG